MNNKDKEIYTGKASSSSSKYELKDVVCDYGIYENGELKLIINNYMNAKYILDILKYDENKKRYPNMITLR